MIDYERMKKVHPQQKRLLAKAVATKDVELVKAACRSAVAEWDAIGAWPDDWSHWQRALNDLEHWSNHTRLEDL